MKTFLNLFTLFVVGSSLLMACHGAEGSPQEPSSPKNAAVPKIKVEFPSAILLKPKEVKSVDAIREVQEEYVRKRFEGYEVVYNMYVKDDNGRFIETFSLKNDEGKQGHIYFDMTDVYKKLKQKDKETKKKIEALEESYMTIEVK